MKKILLAAAFFAVASLNSFAATCANDTLANLATQGNCDIVGWNLSTWGFGAGGSSAVGYTSTTPLTSDIFVTFNSAAAGVNTPAWFSVSFSDAAGGENFFSSVSGTPNQTVSWRSIFVVNGAAIAEVESSVQGASVTPGGNNGSIVLQKILRDPTQTCIVGGNPVLCPLGDQTILTTALGSAPGTSVDVYGPNQSSTITQMGVIDNYQLNAGNSGAASLTSYTNSFYGITPSSGVPEPMTFVLMGAGLVGIAALRRRNG